MKLNLLGYLGTTFFYPFAEKYTHRDILSKLSLLNEFQKKNFTERSQIQKNRILDALRYASLQVPYYQELFQRKKISIEKIEKDFSYFEDIPYLTKEDLTHHADRLISLEYKDQFLHSRRTNGSTGPSLTVKYSPSDLDWSAASNLHIYQFCDRPLHKREVHLSSQLQHQPSRSEIIYGIAKGFALNRRNVFTRNFDATSMNRLFQELRRKKPFLVQGHPSTLYALAKFVEKSIRKPISLFSVFESTGETLDLKKESAIHHWLKCKVFNRYGGAEMGIMAHSRENPFELEVLDFLVYPENHLINSAECELVMTSLFNRAMPYIRYRTGDLGEVFQKNNKQMIRRLFGRVHDQVLIHNNLLPTHFIQDVIYLKEEIEEFQVFTDQEHRLKSIRIALKDGPAEEQKTKVTHYLEDYFGRPLPIDFCNLDALKKFGNLQKFRYVDAEEN